MKFDHVGVVVKDISLGLEHFSKIIPIEKVSEVFEDKGIDVYIQFVEDNSGICYELIAPISDKSPISQALKTGARILNHVAYLVPELRSARETLLSGGCIAAGSSQPAIAYGGRHVQFFVTPLRFIIELIEAPDHQHAYHNIK